MDKICFDYLKSTFDLLESIESAEAESFFYILRCALMRKLKANEDLSIMVLDICELLQKEKKIVDEGISKATKIKLQKSKIGRIL